MNFCKDCRHYVHISGAPNNCIEIHECRQPESVKKFNLVTGDVEPASLTRPDAYANRTNADGCGPIGKHFEPKRARELTETEKSLEEIFQYESLKFCKDCRCFSGYLCNHPTSKGDPDPVTGTERWNAAWSLRLIHPRTGYCGTTGQHFIHKDSPIEDRTTETAKAIASKTLEVDGCSVKDFFCEQCNMFVTRKWPSPNENLCKFCQGAMVPAIENKSIQGPCTHCGAPDHWRPDCPNLKALASRLLGITPPQPKKPFWKRIFK